MASSWKTVRVFISSTFRDMQAERDWLVRFVFPRLREKLLKYRIHFVDVDLRWGVTGDQDALEVCREVIDECQPRFMCILGGRYGWVPAGRTDSITADEVRYGVLEREAGKRGHAFFYFREEQATAQMVEQRTGDFRDSEGSESAVRLTALKQSILDSGLPVFSYPAHWDAGQNRLTGLEAFGSQVHADLLRSLTHDPALAARFSTVGAVIPDEFADESEQMEAFIEERTERFVVGSREPLLRNMLAFAAADGMPSIFVLTGTSGSGKSAFLASFCRALALSTRHFGSSSTCLTVPHFIGASTGSSDLRSTLRRLCHELALATNNTQPMPLDLSELITHFQSLLIKAASRRHIVLVFDALNQFNDSDGAHLMNWLPLELPPRARIVASVIAPANGQVEHQTLAILRTRPGTQIVKLPPLTKMDTLAIIEGYLKRHSKRLSPEQIAALIEKPAGHVPLYVLTALEELRTLGGYEEITDRIRTLPGDAQTLFGWILTQRLARDPGFGDQDGRPCGAALVTKFATYLRVSRRGLSTAELTALLDPGDPLGNVAALLRLLRPYLMRRGELLDFYHGELREAIEIEFFKSAETKREAHACLASYFALRPRTFRAVDELPWQYEQCGDIASLKTVLLEQETFMLLAENAPYDLLQRWNATNEVTQMGSLLENALQRWEVRGSESGHRFEYRVGKFLLLASRFQDSARVLKRAKNGFVEHGESSGRDYISCRCDEAEARGRLGERSVKFADEYRDLFKQTLAEFGEDSDEACRIRHHLARLLGNLESDSHEWIDLHQANHRIRVLKLGACHPDTLTTLYHLGRAAVSHGDLQEAERIYREVLSGRVKALGKEHPDTLTAYQNLCVLLLDRFQDFVAEATYDGRSYNTFPLPVQEAYGEALKCAELAYTGRRRTMGELHADTLNAEMSVAMVLGCCQQFSDSLRRFDDVLEKMISTLGETHANARRAMECKSAIRMRAAVYSRRRLIRRVPALLAMGIALLFCWKCKN